MVAKLLSITLKVALSALLAAIVGALVLVTVVPRAIGGAALTVLTGSMTPEIPVGSVVLVRPVDPRTLQVGDVVTYQPTPGVDNYITHRITAIHADTDPVTLTTKGDANRGEDAAPVPVTAVRGKVLFSVPFLGTLRNAIGVGASGMLLLVLALFGYAAAQVVQVLRDRRAAPTALSSDAPVPVADGEIRLQTLTAMLPLDAFPGLSAAAVAELLRVDLVDEGPDSFTIAVVREPEQIDTLVELLEPFAPRHTNRSTGTPFPACRPPLPTQLQAREAGRDHVAA